MAKPKNQKRAIRALFLLLFAAAFVYSLLRLAHIQWEYRRADEIYDAARAESFQLPVSAAEGSAEAASGGDVSPPAAQVDIDALVQINPDIVGWIWIPGTEISYPLVYGQDNVQYLTHTYNLERSPAGSIFIDCRNARALTDDNTIVYGHNMKNGSMFGGLKAFADRDYLKEHASVYIYTRDGVRMHQIFSAYKTEVTSKSYTRSFSGAVRFADFIGSMPAVAAPPPPDNSPILTLSTCTAGRETERFVVHAALIPAQP